MIQSRRLEEFVRKFMHLRNEDLEERTMWEMWLHKVFDKTYEDFRNMVKGQGTEQDEPDLAGTVRNSMNVLGNFSPADMDEQH